VVQQLGIWSMLPPILTMWTPKVVFALVAVDWSGDIIARTLPHG
jgi:hypothetical protein